VGMVRIDFPGYGEEGKLQPIDWNEWFEKFEQKRLPLVYQEETHGQKSNFNKLISRDSAEAGEQSGRKTRHAG
jgi:hypothetical protein